MGTKNERLAKLSQYRDEKLQLEQQVERGEVGEETLEPTSCVAVQSNYDLRPR